MKLPFLNINTEKRNYTTYIEAFTNKNSIDFTAKNAMKIPSIAESINLIAGSIASMPLYLYIEDTQTRRVKRIVHPLEQLLNEDTSIDMNGYTFKKLLTTDLLFYGKSYFYIERDGLNINGLHHVNYNTVSEKVIVDSLGIIRGKDIHYTLNNINLNAPETDFLIVDFGSVGILNSEETIETFKELIDFQRYTLKNSALPVGVLQATSRLSKQTMDYLKESWKNLYVGNKNAGRTVVLEDGLTYKPVSLNPEQLQMTELEQCLTEQIERLFGLHSVKNNDDLFLKRTLSPVINCIETAISTTLLTEKEKKEGYFCRFMTSELLRPSSEKLFAMYGSALKNGFMSLEEVRAELDLESFFDDDRHDQLMLSLGNVLMNRQGISTILNMATQMKQGENNGSQKD